jgi:sugar lactone lactonase YvrE
LRFKGGARPRVTPEGELAVGDLRLKPPVAQQEGKTIGAHYSVRANGDIGFDLDPYDHAQPLTIDPVVSYSTYLGGSVLDSINAIAVDSSGNVYVTGTTSSLDFPVTSGAYAGGTSDAFIAKLNPGGTALIYATYIGGSAQDSGTAIAVDSAGNALVTGSTTSSDFPVMFSGTSSYVPSADVFVTKVNSSGVITVSRYLVGSNAAGAAIAVDSGGNAYVTGSTGSAAFPVTTGSLATVKPNTSGLTGFIAKLDGSLAVSYGTYLGGTNSDFPTAIAVDSSGDAFIAGIASSANFPVTAGAYQTVYKASGDAFVSELNAQGSALVYSTFLGGSGSDRATAIAIDSGGNAYVAGSTQSTDFPTTAGAFLTSKPSYSYNNSSFIAKLSPGGATLDYSSYLGGSGVDSATGLAVDASGNAYLLGTTSSANFPTTPGAVKTQRSYVPCCSYSDGSDLYLSEFNATGTSLLYSTYFGTSATDTAGAIALDSSLGAYIAGQTSSLAYPTTPSAFQRTSKGGGTGFIAKIDFSSLAVCNVVLSSNSANVPGHGGPGSFTFAAASGCPWEITASSFITVSSAVSGFGNGTVNYTVAPNLNTFTTQTGTIEVNGGVLSAGSNIFTATQAAGSCTDPVFTPGSLNFGPVGGLESIAVALPSGCNWNLANVPSWLTPSNSVSSSGSGILSLYAAPNSYSARMATITLATKTFTVTQAAGACTISLSGGSATVPPQATAGSVGLTTGSACTWEAYSAFPWIQIGATSVQGSGSGSVSYVVAANPGTAPRTGSLLIGDQTFLIPQSGGPGYIPLSYTSAPYTSNNCCGTLGDGGPVGNAYVSDPYQLSFDTAGSLYIADTGDGRIRRVDPTGVITTFAGGGSGLGDGGPPTAASFSPRGVAVDGAGNVYIADTGNNRIRKVTNNVITTIAGTGVAGYSGDNQAATLAQINQPFNIAVDNSGNVYFTDTGNNRIRKITQGGVISTIAGTGALGFSGDGGAATLAALNTPSSLWIDATGNLYFIDTGNYRVREVSAAGIITTVAGSGSYGSAGDGGPATSAQLSVGCCFFVGGLAVDGSTSIYIGGYNDLRKVTPDGIIRSISTYINGYFVSSLGLDSSGNIYTAMSYGIYKFTPAPTFCTYTVSQPGAQTAAGDSFTIQVNATTSSCGWTASSNASWIMAQTANGSGNGTALFTVAGNSSSSSRSGTITLAGQTFTVNQSGLSGAGSSTATHFSVTAPSSAAAGVPVQFTVTALDSAIIL